MMAEMTRVDQESLGGGYSSEVYFGGYIPQLNNLYLAAKAFQVNGNHYEAFINFASSVGVQLAAVCSLRVFRDNTDADNEFSVFPGAIVLPGGLRCGFAGATNLGTLSTGVHEIWATMGPSITIGVGAALPDPGSGPPLIHLATIEMPADGPWKPSQHLILRVGEQAVTPPSSMSRIIRRDITIDDDGTIALESLPAGAIVTKASIVVHVAFDGAAPTIDVGDAGDPDRIVSSAGPEPDCNLGVAGSYLIEVGYRYTALTALTAAVDIDGSTGGEASIILEVV